MHTQPLLEFTGAFLTFWLRIAVLGILCGCIVRMLRRPQHRFLLWAAFLLASATYWAGILLSVAKSALLPSAPVDSLGPHPSASIERFLVSAKPAALIGRGVMVCGVIYLAALAFFICRRFLKTQRLRALLRFASAPDLALDEAMTLLCRELGVKRCKLLVLPAMISPGTVYWWKPCILLPESCSESASSDLVDVLRHELVHIVRRDYLIAGLSDAICALLFFHPAVWLARKNMRLERELACDLAVVEARPEHRADYADNLARFMRMRMIVPARPSPGIDFADSASVLGTRIRSILAEPRKTPWWRNAYAAGAGVFCLVLFVRCAPALSFEFDLNSALPGPNVAEHKTAAQPEARHNRRRRETARRAKPIPVSADSPFQYPDNLTTLPLQETRSRENGLLVSASSQSSAFTGDEDSLPLWAESQPRHKSSRITTVREVILATAGGIALGDHDGRSEHGSHGHKLTGR